MEELHEICRRCWGQHNPPKNPPQLQPLKSYGKRAPLLESPPDHHIATAHQSGQSPGWYLGQGLLAS
eukprot:10216874-Karenia_brevis.AAC.1